MPKILDQYGKPFTVRRSPGKPRVRGSYDAAQTTDENRRHWAAADGLSARAATDPETRRIVRERAQYEVENDCYLSGAVDTIANDVVGTGPRPQLTIPGVARRISRQIEKLYLQWAQQIDYAEDLRIAEKQALTQGEAFGLHITNPKLDRFLPQLDIRLYEGAQVSTPDLYRDLGNPKRTDGIEFDDWGNPEFYHFLKAHPGSDSAAWYGWRDKERIPAERVWHWFRPTRAGQARGVPEVLPALPLSAFRRRHTLAAVSNAELTATICGVLESDQPAAENPEYTDGTGADDEQGSAAAEPWQRIEYERGAFFTAPNQWKAKAFDGAQPTAEYGPFQSKLLTEQGRCLNAPLNVFSGDSSGASFSSARMDHLIYHRAIRVRRSRMAARILDRDFRAFLREAFALGLLPAELPPIAHWTWCWFWDGFQPIDEVKEAQANQINLQSHLTNLAEIYADYGQDWEEQLEQRARELQRLGELERQYGVSFSAAAAPPTTPVVMPAEENEPAGPPATETNKAGAPTRAHSVTDPRLRAIRNAGSGLQPRRWGAGDRRL